MKSPTYTYSLLVICIAVQMAFISLAQADDEQDKPVQNISKLISPESKWSLQFPKVDLVVYKGQMNSDKLGTNQQQMLYPAAGAAGFLAALITHGIITESIKNHQKTKAEEAADKVLAPYQAILGNFHQKELMQMGLQQVNANDKKRLTGFGDQSGSEWSIESVPVFSMTQDQKAIILENSITIFTQKSPTTPVYQNIITVISQSRTDDENPVNFWTANNGEKLKAESANLFGDSLNIILSQITIDSSDNNRPYKTFRYIEGGHEQMERGQLIDDDCNRIVIKTLRDEFMSIPKKHDAMAGSSSNNCS